MKIFKIVMLLLSVLFIILPGCGGGGGGSAPAPVPVSSAKAITAFSLAGQVGAISEAGKTIAVTMPFGTNVTSLTPAITHTGASISPASGVAQNFTSPVTYTVTAADATTQNYTVTVTVAPSWAKAITVFTFPTSTGTTIDEDAHTVAITVPFGTERNGLGPTITHTGASISPASGVAQDFTSPATYTVTAADATTQPYTVTVTVEHLAMISVPAGSFQRDATPANISTVSTFRMSRTEITRAMFLTIMETDPSNEAVSSGTSDPVQRVNWYQAITFCNKLSIAEGLTPVYSVSGIDFTTLTFAQIPTSSSADWSAASANWTANGYRLPTEMEWMWAAMGADTANPGELNTTGYSKLFAGSDGANPIGDYAWYEVNAEGKTHPVGTKTANELGLRDMSGNVWEWCWDWAGDYPTDTVTDYRGPDPGVSLRVGRGGHWNIGADYLTIAYRNNERMFDSINYVGFRVVRP